MAQSDKDLLLKDLYARLPYGVKVQAFRRHSEEDPTIIGYPYTLDFIMMSIMFKDNIEEYKPYLFPLSSMTMDQAQQWHKYANDRGGFVTELPFEIVPYETAIRRFYKLLICRDAYWKIYGEDMGLDKSWEPDWKNTKNVKYGITLYDDTITKMYLRNENVILAFPTEEMRDAFYVNFKDLIEQCKELL